MIQRTLTVTLLAAAMLWTSEAAAQTSPTETLAAKARGLEGRGRPDLAAQTWQQVLLADPNNTEALAGLARYARQSGKTQEAKIYLDRLRKINPHHPALEQIQSMSVLSQQQTRLREAERLAANQQFEQAMEIYRELFGDDPPPGRLAIAYYETLASVPGGWEAATEGLRKITEKYPDAEDYRLSYARLLTYRPATRSAGLRLLESIKGSTDLSNKARQAWRQALVWEGSNPQVLPSLRAYLAKYPDAELQKVLDQGVQASAPQTQAGLARGATENLGYAALKANNIKEAETQFQKALKDAPRSSGALAGMGFVRMKQEDFSGAVSYFQAAAADAPQDKLITEALETASFWKTMKDGNDAFKANQLGHAASFYRKASETRPDSPDAVQGLAGVLVKTQDFAAAAPLYEKLTQMQPQNDEAWRQLINSRYRSVGPASALATLRQLPDSVQQVLSGKVEYLAMLASVYSDAGQNAESKKYLQQAVDLANSQGRELPVALQLQFAGLFLRHGYLDQAAAVFEQVVEVTPDDVNGWEGLIAALVQARQEAHAMRVLGRMSDDTKAEAMRSASFLRSLASIQMSLGQPDQAETYLKKSLELETSTENKESVAVQLQLAHVWLGQNRPEQAETLLRKLAGSYPDNPDVWKALVAALHQEGRDQAALAEQRHVPPEVAQTLQSDPDYVSLLAASESGIGATDDALRLTRRASGLMRQMHREEPADLQIQLAWLLLNTQSDERELYTLLQTCGARNDLTPQQSQSIASLWSTWSLRRAQAAIAAGDAPRAVSILEGAVRLLPKDINLRSALAGELLSTSDFEKALKVYREWGLSGAKVNDYSGAVGAAMSEGDNTLAAVWLRTGLARWPNDSQLLSLAGKLAMLSGDYKRAESYLRSALVAMPKDPDALRLGQPVAALPISQEKSPTESLGQLLLGADPPITAPPSDPTDYNVIPSPLPRNNPIDSATPPPALPGRHQPAGSKPVPSAMKSGVDAPVASDLQSSDAVARQLWGGAPVQNGARTQNAAYVPNVRPVANVLPGLGQAPSDPGATEKRSEKPKVLPTVPGTSSSDTAVVNTPADPSAMRNQLESQLDAIEARNSSFVGTGGSVSGRSGADGFDRLIVQQADLEASTVLGDRIRVAVIAHPTFLDAGTPDGQDTRRFGLLPAGSTFASQSIGGIGGEAQISTETLGIRIGATPRNFLVSNFIGGIRYRPGKGPITLLAERDIVRDSLLSYAGAKDPVSNQVWGGVVANTFSATGNWGGAKSGFYASFGFHNITGTNVESNTALDGNTGVYWRVLSTDDGALTAGFNITGMHYDKNLRYFTLGQGGYFSPQSYMLISIPVQWRGVYKNKLQYEVRASLGTQHFQEDASPFFPTLPALQGKNGPMYAANAVTGASYSLDAHIGRQLTPVWFLGAWINLNNALDYNAQSAAIYLRYTTRPRLLNANSSLPSIPDWRGVEPFRLW